MYRMIVRNLSWIPPQNKDGSTAVVEEEDIRQILHTAHYIDLERVRACAKEIKQMNQRANACDNPFYNSGIVVKVSIYSCDDEHSPSKELIETI